MSTLSIEAVSQISVAQYHSMIENGILGSDDRLELLDGYLVDKMPNNPLHASTIHLILSILGKIIPESDCHLRVQSPVTLSKSEPEPDIVLVRGTQRDYFRKHPQPADILVLIEVADSSLKQDQTTKHEIYARAGIGIYWIVNLVQKVVEVYTLPSGPQTEPVYRHRDVYTRADSLPLEIEGKVLASMPVSEILPRD